MNNSETRLSDNDKYFNTDHIRSDLKKRTVRGAGITIFTQILSFILQLLSIMVLARLLTPVDFGLVTMVTTFSLLLLNFGANGLTEVIIQREDINHTIVSTLFWINIIASFTLTLIFMIAAPFIAWFYHEPLLKLITIGIALTIIANGLSTIHTAILQRNMQFYESSIISIASKIISVLLAIFLAWLGFGYWALVAGAVIGSLTSAFGVWILCRWRPSFSTSAAGITSMIKFALNTYGNFFLNYCTRNLDNLLVGWRYGSLALGFYKKAYDMFGLPVGQITVPLTNVALAALSRLSHDPEKYRRHYSDALSMLAFIGMPISAILTLTGKDVILFILGPQWGRAGEIFIFFGIGIAPMMLYYTTGWLHLSLGRADRWFRWGIIELIVTSLFFVIGLPFGIVGMAIAWTVSFYVLLGPGIWYAGQPINLKMAPLALVTWKYFVSALAAGLISFFILQSFDVISQIFIQLNILLRIIVSSVLCLSIYLLLIIVLYRSFKPISQFFSLLQDMLPASLVKKSKLSTT